MSIEQLKGMHKVHLLNADCYLRFGYYGNGTVAITAYNYTTHEPHCVPTVNWEKNWKGVGKYSVKFKFPLLVVKNYSENKGVFQDLMRAGVIDLAGPYMQDTGGTVQISRLSEKWQRIAKQMLPDLE